MISLEQLKAEFGPYGSKEYPEVYAALRLLEETERQRDNALRILEAERQRADELQAEQKQHDAQIEQMEGKILLLTLGFRLKTKHCEKAEAELAALKGGQVPVAEIKFHPSTDKHPCMYWFGKQDRDFPVGTQFFTAPQKPVVPVPVGFLFVVKATGAVIYSIAASDIDGAQLVGPIYGDLAIEAAGGIVKVAE